VAGFVQVSKVNAYSNLSIIFYDWDDVKKPCGVLDRFDESCSKQLYYFILDVELYLRLIKFDTLLD